MHQIGGGRSGSGGGVVAGGEALFSREESLFSKGLFVLFPLPPRLRAKFTTAMESAHAPITTAPPIIVQKKVVFARFSCSSLPREVTNKNPAHTRNIATSGMPIAVIALASATTRSENVLA